MRNLYAIYRKEMGHYFVSPIAYVFIGVFLLINAFVFNLILVDVISNAFKAEMQAMQFGMATPIDVTLYTLRGFLGWLSTPILLFTPILTMSAYAEERKRGTMELLMTSPVSELQIVLGKYLASLSLFAIMLLPTAGYMVFIFLRSNPVPPWRMLIVGYTGVLLLGAALLALGTFISSLTENQIIAAVLTIVAFLFVFLLGIGSDATSGIGSVVQYLAVNRHLEDFSRGVVDTSSLIYYFSFIVLFLFLTVRSIDSMRWRRA